MTNQDRLALALASGNTQMDVTMTRGELGLLRIIRDFLLAQGRGGNFASPENFHALGNTLGALIARLDGGVR